MSDQEIVILNKGYKIAIREKGIRNTAKTVFGIGSLTKQFEAVLWTVGHSNRTIKYFVDLLKEHEIEVLVDARRFPTSKVKHFKRQEMENCLLF